MPSRGNPNVPNKLKRKASRVKVQKRNAGKVTKNARGTAASSVLHPTGGPAAPLSSKKARKVEKALNHARRRVLEAEMVERGEVTMTDAPKTTKPKTAKAEANPDEMQVDEIK